MKIPFNVPPRSKNEEKYIGQAIGFKKLSGEGIFNKKCAEWFKNHLQCEMAVITPSCTSALEMAMVLADIGPGDEVILPSFTFTSTANVIALYGATPVFVDVDPQTMNIDVAAMEKALTPKTKVVMPVHYAGVGCEMDKIMALSEKHNFIVVADAAQAIFASYKGKPLGAWGHMAAYSFHETKNIVCGEGGALIINDPRFVARAEIVRDKGTNRQQFLNGQVDKYTWQDKGSSYLQSELAAAFLLSQLEEGEQITAHRLAHWNQYHQGFADLEKAGKLTRMTVPAESQANAHIYYILLNSAEERAALWSDLKEHGIQSTTHYVPLHSAPAGVRFGRVAGSMKVTDDQANRLLRMPMYADLTPDDVNTVLNTVRQFFARKS
ncbi:dTDP-4-amino-4,6-dideoxygalactose transaminase [Bdellovibrio svalbardensis]|uniref:dTDP-4-amino-4,6-dideoxygalactose transaminase n=1 Tax=Bdellovibrio svalbardensis TaxID=2972972 RepID=A0ABT6DNJ6_9BACT|nr:dTDP-4-amino-4,6-dideoxygalactose transaminase [Bdellovibrio svalbardensis]MDG0816708.1 dTDP-4-amino-4,6-dideoxygalactose transaminase [Bdellovibrio svalbardensis]